MTEEIEASFELLNDCKNFFQAQTMLLEAKIENIRANLINYSIKNNLDLTEILLLTYPQMEN